MEWEQYKQLTKEERVEYEFKFGEVRGFGFSKYIVFGVAYISLFSYSVLAATFSLINLRNELLTDEQYLKLLDGFSLISGSITVFVILALFCVLIELAMNVYESDKENEWIKERFEVKKK